MYQPLSTIIGGRFVVLRDGRISGLGQPEPAFLQRRYEQAEALKEIRRESRIKAVLAGESESFVDRIRVALGIA